MNTKVAILGAGGMLGNSLFRYFAAQPDVEVLGTLRGLENPLGDFANERVRFKTGIDVTQSEQVQKLVASFRPDYLLKCVGIIKQLKEAGDRLQSVQVNSLLPHQLDRMCRESGARLIHFSTDCVFSGKTGMYLEDDFADADDVYGRSKFLGEVVNSDCALTLRTSIIGHELGRNNSLIDWFLSQTGEVRGFTRAIFSGLPMVEVANVVDRIIRTRPNLSGLYHLSVDPIAKYELLTLVKEMYSHPVEIRPDDALVIDRSLNSDRLREELGYCPPAWPELVARMREFG